MPGGVFCAAVLTLVPLQTARSLKPHTLSTQPSQLSLEQPSLLPSLPPRFATDLAYFGGADTGEGQDGGFIAVSEPDSFVMWYSMTNSEANKSKVISAYTWILGTLRCDYWKDTDHDPTLKHPDMADNIQANDCVCAYQSLDTPIFPWPSFSGIRPGPTSACPQLNTSEDALATCESWYVPLGTRTWWWLFREKGTLFFDTGTFSISLTGLETPPQHAVSPSVHPLPTECKLPDNATSVKSELLDQTASSVSRLPRPFASERCTPALALSGSHVYRWYAGVALTWASVKAIF